MKIQTKAVNVLETASNALKSGLLREKPVWFDVIAKYPPKHNLIKKAHEQPSHKPKTKTNIHEIPKLKFIEDTIRDTFYKHHPWELARPKSLIEVNGDEINKKCDWKRLQQIYKPLDGESVVQRTMYLVQNESKSIFDAYDQARFEFYKLRMAEEMQSHVAKEESIMYGAIIKNNFINTNWEKESEYIKSWVEQGGKETKVLEASSNRSQAPSGSIIETENNQTSLFENLINSDKL